MKKILFLTISILISINLWADKELVIKGIYQGENIFVMNPFAPSGVGFCVYEVTVNGQMTTDEINSSAFEIDLSVFNFKPGDPVTIVLKHKDGCSPKILNYEVLKPRATFNIVKIAVDKSGKLTWVTSGEIGALPFFVEQYRWNKWIRVAKVEGKGTPEMHSYSAKVNLHSGLNKFRIKQVDYTKKPRYSQIVTYNNPKEAVTFKPGDGKKATDKITFSRKTMYEIYDYYGHLKLKGYDTEVDISSLEPGMYFLNFDNRTSSFIKR